MATEKELKQMYTELNRLSNSTMDESRGNYSARAKHNQSIRDEFNALNNRFNSACEKFKKQNLNGQSYIDWLNQQNFQ